MNAIWIIIAIGITTIVVMGTVNHKKRTDAELKFQTQMDSIAYLRNLPNTDSTYKTNNR
jgi:hypothetical protein